MAESRYLTLDEELKIGLQVGKLHQAGRYKEAHELATQLPISPSVAKVWVTFVGKEALRNSGYNMYEVEKAYGKDWLNS